MEKYGQGKSGEEAFDDELKLNSGGTNLLIYALRRLANRTNSVNNRRHSSRRIRRCNQAEPAAACCSGSELYGCAECRRLRHSAMAAPQ
jgi:protein-arginine kinase activator protein McsA